jgi:hypothetical protein
MLSDLLLSENSFKHKAAKDGISGIRNATEWQFHLTKLIQKN